MFTVNKIKAKLEPYTTDPKDKLASYIAGIMGLNNRYLEGIKTFFDQHNSDSSLIATKHPRALIKEIDALFSEEKLKEPISCNELNDRETLLQSLLNSINEISNNRTVKYAINIVIPLLPQSLVINNTKIQSINDITSALKGYLEKIKEIRKKSRPQGGNLLIPNTLNSAPIAESNGNDGSRPQSIQEISASTAHNNLFFLIFYFFSTYLSPLLNSSLLYTRMIGHNDENQLPQKPIDPTKHSTSTQGNPDNKSLIVIDGKTPLFIDNNELSEKLTQEVKNLREQFPNLPKNIKTLLSNFSCSKDKTIHDSISRF